MRTTIVLKKKTRAALDGLPGHVIHEAHETLASMSGGQVLLDLDRIHVHVDCPEADEARLRRALEMKAENVRYFIMNGKRRIAALKRTCRRLGIIYRGSSIRLGEAEALNLVLRDLLKAL